MWAWLTENLSWQENVLRIVSKKLETCLSPPIHKMVAIENKTIENRKKVVFFHEFVTCTEDESGCD